MSHKSLWFVEFVITAIVLIAVGSLVIPLASTAEQVNPPTDTLIVDDATQ